MPPAREQMFLLDWIRFAAAVIVSGWHLGYRLFDPGAQHINRFSAGLPPDQPIAPAITIFGWIGVQIFFVISGLVIAFSASRGTASRFFINRAARLYPVILVGTVLIAGIDILAWHMPVARVAREAMLTLVFSPVATIAPQFWTIPVEAVFYACIWGLIRTGRFEQVEIFALVMLAIDAAYWALVGWGGLNPMTQFARVLLLQHGCYFAVGIAIYRMAEHGLSVRRGAIVLSGCILAIQEIRFALTKYQIAAKVGPDGWTVPYGVWLASLAMIAAAVRYRAAIGRFTRRWALAGVSRAVGLATYPLYFLHLHIGGLVAAVAVENGMPPGAAVMLGFLAALVVSLWLALMVEPRLAGWIRQIAQASA
jgi:exopolysaccharide production protein ExoZ